MTIGELAKKAGVNIDTIRYYEGRGLIPAPPRTESGYRLYEPEIIRRIRFIKRAKDLGFSLKEISELLSLRVDKNSACADVRIKAEKKISEIEERMQTLKSMKKSLLKLVNGCNKNKQTGECPVLEALDLDDGNNSK